MKENEGLGFRYVPALHSFRNFSLVIMRNRDAIEIPLLPVLIKPFRIFQERVKGYAALFETTGQFFYVFAMSSNAIIAAPLIASYSIFSVILSRIFLQERLNKMQYAIIVLVIAGIALLGIADEL
ncbi:EamA family transporter [Paenibacillus thiaminolyticus]|uniref:EamA family transporter n=1 Tax=Paenibacillus thiaminolyticus TaxID=49283 RepID=UPI0035A59CD0